MNINSTNSLNFRGGEIIIYPRVMKEKNTKNGEKEWDKTPQDEFEAIDVDDIESIDSKLHYRKSNAIHPKPYCNSATIITKDGCRILTGIDYKELAEAYNLLKNTPGKGVIGLSQDGNDYFN